MKKCTISFIFVVLIVVSGAGQTNEDRISLSFGPAFPTGNFASTSPSNSMAGYAKSGISATVSFTHNIKNGFGWEAMVYGQQNKINAGIMQKQFNETRFFPGVDKENISGSYTTWKVPAKTWQVASLLVGLSKEFQKDDLPAFAVASKVMIGAGYAHLPAVDADSRMENAYAFYHKDELKGFGLSFLVGGELRYLFSKHGGIHLGVDYFATSRLKSENVVTLVATTNGGLIIPGLYKLENSRDLGPSAVISADEKQTINSINLKAGLSYRF